MNGVRRFLVGGGSSPTSSPSAELQPPTVPPLIISGKPSWPPQSNSPTQADPPFSSPKMTTAALFMRKDRQKAQPAPPNLDEDIGNTSYHSGRSSNASSFMSHTLTHSQTSFATSSSIRPSVASPSSSRAPPADHISPRKSGGGSDWRRTSGLLNTRDELLMSLLASEAMVDSREFDILSAEEVEDLKKEQQVLTARLGAMSKKLSLETKIRDAAISLTKVNAPHKKVAKQSDEQLEAANRRVDAAQKGMWRVSERANEVHKKLLEHRAGVLSFSVRSMEKKMAVSNGTEDTDGSGSNTANRSSMSPTTSSITSVSTSSKSRFDGAHLFAGHADALVPTLRRTLGATEVTALEEKLKTVTDALSAATKKQAEMARELSHLRLEKQEVETMMGMDLQSAEETINALEKELPRLESLDTQLRELSKEKTVWEKDRAQFVERIKKMEEDHRLESLEKRNDEVASIEGLLVAERERNRVELERKVAEIQTLRKEWDADRAAWERDKTSYEHEMAQEMETLRREGAIALQEAHAEVDDGLSALRTLVQNHGIVLFSRDSSLQGLLLSVGTHLKGMSTKVETHAKAQAEWESSRKKLEEDVRNGMDKRESLARDLEEARREREEARREARLLEARVKDKPSDLAAVRSPSTPTVDLGGDTGKIISILRPLWAILPSPEARAAKFGSQRQFRTGSPTPATPSSPRPGPSSISELDVRSLKTLYDVRPTSSPNPNGFTIESFAAKVQALITDDRALIERLLRFAQAHDLLKKNAERAQKLAQESNAALETYQKQVRTLEERNMTLSTKQAEMMDDVQQLQHAVNRISAEKIEVEMHAAEQAETCRQLTDANNVLTARTLTLAEEAASAPEIIKKQLETQLSECKTSLQRAQDEIDAMRMSEQSQRIALLDELNSMQTENGSLRAQLRAAKR